MKDNALSRAVTIDDPIVGVAFASSRLRRILMLFAAGPLSISEAAARSNMELKRLHHYVQKLVRLGLVEVCGARPRAGRAIKIYRATSDAYFIPEETFPKPFGDELSDELREGLAGSAARSSRGLLLTVGANGEPLGRVIARDDASTEAFQMWRILRLSQADFDELRSEIDSVLRRFQSASDGRRQVYLVHAAAIRRADESGLADNS